MEGERRQQAGLARSDSFPCQCFGRILWLDYSHFFLLIPLYSNLNGAVQQPARGTSLTHD